MIPTKERNYITRNKSTQKKKQSVHEVAMIYYKLCSSIGTWIYVAGMLGASFLGYQARDPHSFTLKSDI